MVTSPKIRCAVVTIAADDNGMIETSTATFDAGGTPRRFRPSNRLPWADPCIAGLVRKLQAEVRSERLPGNRPANPHSLLAELEVPWDADAYESPRGDELPDPDDAERRGALPEAVL